MSIVRVSGITPRSRDRKSVHVAALIDFNDVAAVVKECALTGHEVTATVYLIGGGAPIQLHGPIADAAYDAYAKRAGLQPEQAPAGSGA